MKRITQTIKSKYYQYQPGEFLPIYRDGELANKREFHKYKVRQILDNPRAFYNHLVTTRG